MSWWVGPVRWRRTPQRSCRLSVMLHTPSIILRRECEKILRQPMLEQNTPPVLRRCNRCIITRSPEINELFKHNHSLPAIFSFGLCGYTTS